MSDRENPKAVALQRYLGDRHNNLVQWTDGDEGRAHKLRQQAMLAVHNNRALLHCNPASVYMAVVAVVQMGLDLNPFKGSAYIVPYKNVATPIPGYRGLLNLVQRSGISPHAELVYENDHYVEQLGSDVSIDFRPAPFETNRGKMIGGFAAGRIGDELMVVRMSAAELNLRRQRAKRGHVESPAWRDWPEQMYKKTLLKAWCKLAPLDDPRVERAVAVDHAIAGGRHREYAEVVMPADAHLPEDVRADMGQIIDAVEVDDLAEERQEWQELILQCRNMKELLAIRKADGWREIPDEIRPDVLRAWDQRNKTLMGAHGKLAREAANDDVTF